MVLERNVTSGNIKYEAHRGHDIELVRRGSFRVHGHRHVNYRKGKERARSFSGGKASLFDARGAVVRLCDPQTS